MAAQSEIDLPNGALLSPVDIARLMELVNNLATRLACPPTKAIDMLARAADVNIPARDGRLSAFANRIRRVRMRRNEMIGAPLFRDPAWDMLLDLFIAHDQGERVSITSLCFASGVPQSTALRQLARLEQHGLVTREGDPSDLRRNWIKATPQTLASMGEVIDLLAREAANV